MNCQHFALRLMLDCTPIRTRTGDEALFVALPAAFVDGEPLPMYVVQSGRRVHLTDGGDTLFHLHNIGFRILGDKRRWASLRDAIEPFGACMTESGEIEVWTSDEEMNEGAARYVAALLAAANWEVEHFGQPLDGTALIEEVKEYLLALRPSVVVRENIPVKGLSGKIYQFPLSLDGVLIDAMSASPTSSNSMVRKLVDIRAVPSHQATEIEIAVDDRKTGERSEQDIRLLELLATPLRISELRNSWQKATVVH